MSARGTPVDAERTFLVSSIPPGRYRVGAVSGLPPEFYLADVRQGESSVFDSGFEVESRAPGPLEIVIGEGVAVVDGVVQDSSLKTVAGATVVLVPESRRLENRALYATTTSDGSGRFVFRSVAPGDYRLLSWKARRQTPIRTSYSFRSMKAEAQFVHVSQGGRVSSD